MYWNNHKYYWLDFFNRKCSKIFSIVIVFFVFSFFTAQAQVNIGLPITKFDTSAVLQMTTTTKGFLLPRLTNAQRDLIYRPAYGLFIYNTDINQIEVNLGTNTQPLWSILPLGNALVNPTNGLRRNVDSVLLGGTLKYPTVINTSAFNTLAFLGLATGSSSDSLLVANPNTANLFKKRFSYLIQATNGLTTNGDTVYLYGLLNRNTTLTVSPTNTLTIQNLPTAGRADTFYVVENFFSLLSKKVNIIKAYNGLTFLSPDTLKLGGTLTAPTALNTSATNTVALSGLASGNAVNDSILFMNNSNNLTIRSPKSIVQVTNGVAKIGNTLIVSGALNRPTALNTTATNTLAIAGLTIGSNQYAYLLVQNSLGKLSNRNNFKGANGISVIGVDSFVLGGTLISPVVINASLTNPLNLSGLVGTAGVITDSILVMDPISSKLLKRTLFSLTNTTNGVSLILDTLLIPSLAVLNRPTYLQTSASNTLSFSGLPIVSNQDSIMVVNGNNNLQYKTLNSLSQAQNGVSKNTAVQPGGGADTFILGGVLNTPTSIQTNAVNALAIGNLQTSTLTPDSFFVAQNTAGRLIKTSWNANNGVAKAAKDSFILGGVINTPTILVTSPTNTLSLTGLQSGTDTDSIVVVYTPTGVLQKRAFSQFFNYTNGLYRNSDTVLLGAPLDRPTLIVTNPLSAQLSITGLNTGLIPDSFFIVQNPSGLLSKRTLKAGNGLNTPSAGTFQLGGVLSIPTLINTQGLALSITGLPIILTTDSLLFTNSSGTWLTRILSTLTNAYNGISKSNGVNGGADTFLLGGSLSNGNTTIATSATNTLLLSGLSLGAIADSFFLTQNNSGKLVNRTLKVANGLTKNAADSFSLGGTLIIPSYLATTPTNTLSLLDLQSGTGQDSVLTINSLGVLSRRSFTAIVLVTNGLNKVGDTVLLGGTLNRPTTIGTSTLNTLAFNNLQQGVSGDNQSDSFFVTQDANGVLTKRTLKLTNGLTKIGPDSFNFGGTLITPTTLNTSATNTLALQGLQNGTNDTMVILNNGVLQTRTLSTVFSTANGVSKKSGISGQGDTAILGGSLTQATSIITTPTNTLSIQNLSTGMDGDSLFVVQNTNGKLSQRSLKTLNGVSKIGGDSFVLGGTLVYPTSINTNPTNSLSINGLQAGTKKDTFVVLNNGVLRTRVTTTLLDTALNGLSVQNDSILLGGTLTQATTINTSAANSLSINGLQTGTKKDTFLVLNNGVLRTRVTTTLLDTALNGLTAQNDSVLLGGTLTQATTLNTTATNTLSINGLQAGLNSDTFLVMRNGVLKTRAQSTIVDTALNGLTKQSDSVKLGGSLTQPTVIATNSVNTLALTGLQQGLKSDTFLVMRNGVIKTRTQLSIVDTALNGLTKNNDSIILGGTLNRPTTIFTSNINTLSFLGLQPNLGAGPIDSFLVIKNGALAKWPGILSTGLIDTAINGLTKNGTAVLLGGILLSPTRVTTSATNTFALKGLQTGLNTDTFLVLNNGVLKTRLASKVLDTALNGLSQNLDTVKLGGSLQQPTVITTSATNTFSLKGLQTGLNTDTFLVLNNGVLKTRLASKVLDTAFNGLTQNLDTVKLGGSLTQPTIITTNATNTFALKGLQAGLNTDTFVVLNNGVLKTRLASKVLDTAFNGLTQNLDTVKLGGSLTQPTIITTNATNTFALKGLQAGLNTDTFVVLNNGVLKTRIASKVLDTAFNGLTQNLDTVKLGGSLTQPTVITTSATNTFALQGLQTGLNTDTFLVLNNGVLKTRIASKVLDTALNGLSQNLDTVKLGGSLTQPTVITTSATNTLALKGLQTALNTDTFVVLNNGVLKTRLASSVLDTALNGLTRSADTVSLGGTLIKPTTIATSATNTLSLSGLNSIAKDTFVTVNANGVLQYNKLANVLAFSNGLSRIAGNGQGDTIYLNGSLNRPTNLIVNTLLRDSLSISGLLATNPSTDTFYLTLSSIGTMRRSSLFYAGPLWKYVGNNIAGNTANMNIIGTLNTIPMLLKSNSVLVGYLGTGLTSNDQTTFLGYALGGNISNISNSLNSTFIGPLTLNSSFSVANYEVAVGVNTLANSSNGLNNIAIDSGALSNISTGSNNIAIGYKSLVGLTAGLNHNIGMGSSTNATTADTNLLIGSSTNAVGGNNVVVGGNNSITGNFVTRLGFGNISATGLLSKNIFIGSRITNIPNSVGLDIGNILFANSPISSLGIGTSNLSPKILLFDSAQTNPLRLTGLKATVVSYDSILTATHDSGIVRYLSLSNNLWKLGGNSLASNPNAFIGSTDNNLLNLRTNNTTRMVVGSNGYIGIGTTAPAQLLHVNSVVGVATDSNFVFTRAGLAGIGVTNPTNALDDSSSSAGLSPLRLIGLQYELPPSSAPYNTDTILFASNNTGVVTTMYLPNRSTTVWSLSANSITNSQLQFVGFTNNQKMRFATDDTVRLVVDSVRSYVGIGTTAPVQALDIRYNNNSLMLLGAKAYMGIGTTNPLQSVHVTSANNLGSVFFTDSGRISIDTPYVNRLARFQVITKLGRVDTVAFSDSGRLGIGLVNASAPIQVSTVGTPYDSVLIYVNKIIIGSNPGNKSFPLSVVSNANPLSISGLAQTSATTQLLAIKNDTLIYVNPTTVLVPNKWNLSGNSGTNPSVNFVGTTDLNPIKLSANGLPAMTIRVQNGLGGYGLVGIGTSLPTTFFQIATSSQQNFNYLPAGYLGIGTSTPMSALQVLSNYNQLALFSDTIPSAFGASIAFLTNVGSPFSLGMGTTNGSKTALSIAPNRFISSLGRDAFVVTNQGYVGIGTNTPAYQLDVNVTGDSFRIIGMSRDLSSSRDTILTINNGVLRKYNPSAYSWAITGNSNATNSFIGTIDNTPFYLKANNISTVTFLNNKVGIGTALPYYSLHVSSSPLLRNNVFLNDGAIGVGSPSATPSSLRIGFFEQLYGLPYTLSFNDSYDRGSSSLTDFNFTALQFSNPLLSISKNSSGNSASLFYDTTNLYFSNTAYTDAPAYIWKTNFSRALSPISPSVTSLMLLDSSGYLAIGPNQSPLQKLQISQPIAGDTIVITNTGRIGIGTTTPATALQIVSANSPLRLDSLLFDNTTTNVLGWNSNRNVINKGALSVSGVWNLNGNTLGANNYFIGTTNDSTQKFITNGQTRLYIDTGLTTKIGLGTTNPQYLLSLSNGYYFNQLANTFAINDTSDINPFDNTYSYSFGSAQTTTNEFYLKIAVSPTSQTGLILSNSTVPSGDTSDFIIAQTAVNGGIGYYSAASYPFDNIPQGSNHLFAIDSFSRVIVGDYASVLPTVNAKFLLLGSLSVNALQPGNLNTDSIVTWTPGDSMLRMISPNRFLGWSILGNSQTIPNRNFVGTIDNTDFRLATNSTTATYFKSNGNVGIGTTNPINLLHIQGSGGTPDSVTFTNYGGLNIRNPTSTGVLAKLSIDSNALYVNPYSLSWNSNINTGTSSASVYTFSGNTSTAGASLSLNKLGGSAGAGAVWAYDTINNYFALFSTTLTPTFVWKNKVNAGSYDLFGTGNNLMTLTTNGNLGLGVSSSVPDKLDIGTSASTRFVFSVSAGAKLGVNTTTPLYALDVVPNGSDPLFRINPNSIPNITTTNTGLVLRKTGNVNVVDSNRNIYNAFNSSTVWTLNGNSTTNYIGSNNRDSVILIAGGVPAVTIHPFRTSGYATFGSDPTISSTSSNIIASIGKVPLFQKNFTLGFGDSTDILNNNSAMTAINFSSAWNPNGTELLLTFDTFCRSCVGTSPSLAGIGTGDAAAGGFNMTFFSVKSSGNFRFRDSISFGTSPTNLLVPGRGGSTNGYGAERFTVGYNGTQPVVGLQNNNPAAMFDIDFVSGVNPMRLRWPLVGNIMNAGVQYLAWRSSDRYVRILPQDYVGWKLTGDSGALVLGGVPRILGTTDNRPLNFLTNSADGNGNAMLVSENGNVRIGRISTPASARLVVISSTGGLSPVANDSLVFSNGSLRIDPTATSNLSANLVLGKRSSAQTISFESLSNTLSVNENLNTGNSVQSDFHFSSTASARNSVVSLAKNSSSNMLSLGYDGSSMFFATTPNTGNYVWKNGTSSSLTTDNSGVTLMSLLANGNLGIGLSAPTQLLQLGIGVNANTDSVVVITNGGRIGIGTTAPAKGLDILKKNLTNIVRVRNLVTTATYTNVLTLRPDSSIGTRVINSSNYTTAWLLSGNTGISASDFLGMSDAGSSLNFGTNGNPLFTISNSGYIGIGTTNPSNLLDIPTNGSTPRRIVMATTGNFGIGTLNPVAYLHVTNYLSSSDSIYLRLNNSAGASMLVFQTSNPSTNTFAIGMPSSSVNALAVVAGQTTSTAGNQVMVLTNTGRLGIGNFTTSSLPTYFLDVAGTSDPVNITGLTNLSNIGTDSLLTINNTSQTLKQANPNRFAFILNGNNLNGTGTVTIGTSDANNFNIATNGSGRMTLSNNGKVGIGTTTPSNLFTVAGSSTNFVVDTNANGRIQATLGTVNADYPFPLYINTSTSFNYALPGAYFVDTTGAKKLLGFATEPAQDVSIYTNGFMVSALNISAVTLEAASDARIKNILNYANTAQDLATLNRLQVTNYQYRDTILLGNKIVKKFIAQQVEKVYPNAVSEINNYIPNIYQLATKVISNNGDHDFVLNFVKPIHLENTHTTGMVKIIDQTNNEHLVSLVKLINDHAILVKTSNGLNLENGSYFVYGQQVNDFRVVDYSAITALNISATQELDKQLNQNQVQLDGIRQGMQNNKQRLDLIEQRVQSYLATKK